MPVPKSLPGTRTDSSAGTGLLASVPGQGTRYPVPGTGYRWYLVLYWYRVLRYPGTRTGTGTGTRHLRINLEILA